MGFGDALRRRKAVCLGWPAVVLQGSAAVPPRGSSDCLQPTGGLGYVAALWVGLRLSALSVPFIYLKLTNRPFTGGTGSGHCVQRRSSRSMCQDFIIQAGFCQDGVATEKAQINIFLRLFGSTGNFSPEEPVCDI